MWQRFDFNELTSTNDLALALSASAAGQKLAITAARQTSGRGRRGRSWVCLEGNLFLSLAIPFAAEQSAVLVFVSSLALFEAVKSLDQNVDVVLKWPNDVLLNGGKMSGILLEKGDAGYMIIGIGVNIQATPEGGTLYPTTCLRAAGINTDREEFKEIYLRCFDALMSLWSEQGMKVLVEKWQKHAKGIGRNITVRLPKITKTGVFAGLDDEGMLILQTPAGCEIISAGDVFFDDESKKEE